MNANRHFDRLVALVEIDRARKALAWTEAFLADKTNDLAAREYFARCLPGQRKAFQDAKMQLANA